VRRPSRVGAAAIAFVAVSGLIVAAAAYSGRSRPVSTAPPPRQPTSVAPLPDPPTDAAMPTPTRPASSPLKPTATPVPSPAPEPLLPLPAAAVQPRPCPPPARPPVPGPKPKPRPRRPVVAESAVPAPVAVTGRRADLGPLRGKGVWLVYFHGKGIDGEALAQRVRAAGLDQIWVRTGGTRQGRYYGDEVLRAVLLPAHRAGLKVIAWDFPYLSDPAKDADRAVRALRFSIDGHQVDAFSPDIETAAESTWPTARRVRYYLSVVRRAAGSRPVVTTVPRPTEPRLAGFPYAEVARWSDALAPMVYWSCREPGELVSSAYDGLTQFGRPVHVIGQAYDMGPEGGRVGTPSAAETWRFVDMARRRGALGVSLFQWETAGRAQITALSAYPWPGH
jgi:hypothetical protein